MVFSDNQNTGASQVWSDSKYKFTEPVRYYKSNDPYYWEVDNIPIRQLEENILWLKDQLTTPSTSVSGVGRDGLAELQPYGNGSNRTVTVRPGKFMARINDAFNKGITTMVKEAVEGLPVGGENYVKSKVSFELPDAVIRRIVGEIVTGPTIYNNGLYDHLQHHAVENYGDNTNLLEFREGSTQFVQNFVQEAINNIPKNKLALWKPGLTARDYNPNGLDLQQLSVEFTRRWGGVARTALVNVAEELSIQVPSFDSDDLLSSPNFPRQYEPQFRIDLLFIYAHPSDSPETYITVPNGTQPTKITKPKLGLVKGAGVVGLKGTGAFDSFDSINSFVDNFVESQVFQTNKINSSNLFKARQALDSAFNYQITSPISDFYQSEVSVNGNVYGNLPSPDDLMNLAPLLQEGVSNSMTHVGQSVLPLAYIITRKGSSVISSSDIVDIRPFFRTAELAYNERAGIAGANPPLSLANPAVGRRELNEHTRKLSTYVDTAISEIVVSNSGSTLGTGGVIGRGMVLGGTRYGVEGAMLLTAAIKDLPGATGGSITSPGLAADVLRKAHLKGYNLNDPTTQFPEFPGWDISPVIAASQVDNIGEERNDRINFATHAGVKVNPINLLNDTNLDDETLNFLDAYVKEITHTFNPVQPGGYTETPDNNGFISAYHNALFDNLAFVKKRIKFKIPAGSSGFDYTVNAKLINCVPASVRQSSSQTDWDILYNSNAASYNGLFIEKGDNDSQGYANFTIYVAFNAGTQINGGFDDSQPNDSLHGPLNTAIGRRVWNQYNTLHKDAVNAVHRTKSNLSSFRFVHSAWIDTDLDFLEEHIPPIYVTYPTVEFEIIGYDNSQIPMNFIVNNTNPAPNLDTLLPSFE